MLDMDEMRAALKTGDNMFAMVVNFRRFAQALMDEMLDSSIAACEGSDALLYGLMRLQDKIRKEGTVLRKERVIKAGQTEPILIEG